jgi:stage III sporulation protein SpoIIIAA
MPCSLYIITNTSVEHACSISILVEGPEEGGTTVLRNLTRHHVTEYCNLPTASVVAVSVGAARYLAGNKFSWGYRGLVWRICT